MVSGPISYGAYTFPRTIDSWDPNFTNGMPKTTRLPGASGGFNSDGDEAADREIGKVTVGFTLIATDRVDMDAKRDALNAIQQYGRAKLVVQPTDSTDSVRYCWATVNYIYMNQDPSGQTDFWQPVRIIFQVPDPMWLENRYGGEWLIGDTDVEIGDTDITIGGGLYTISASGTSTSDTITNTGNATRMARIYITPGVGDSCQNPTIQRVVNGLVVDEVTYTGTLAAGESLIIDPYRQMIKADGIDAWDDITYKGLDFLSLAPGNNTIRVLFSNGGDAAEVEIAYEDSYL